MKKLITTAISQKTAQKKDKSKKQRGFTLIELVIVVFIITALSSIIVLGYPGIVGKSRMKSDIYSAKTISTAIKIYEMEKERKFSLATGEVLTTKLVDSGYLEPDSPVTPICGGEWVYVAEERRVCIKGATLEPILYQSLSPSERKYFITDIPEPAE